MNIVLTALDAEPSLKPKETFQYANDPLLNSNYKAAEEANFSCTAKSSVFGTRQALKFKQFNTIIPVSVLLKLSLFALVLSMIV